VYFNKEASISKVSRRIKVDFPIEKISIFFLVAIGLVNIIIINLTSLGRGAITEAAASSTVIGGNLAIYIISLIFFMILFSYKKIKLSEVFSAAKNKIPTGTLFGIQLASFAMMYFITTLAGPASLANPVSGFYCSIVFGTGNFLMQLITTVLLIPVVDGIIFRLILMNKLKTALDAKWGIILSSLFFALIQLYISGYNFFYALSTSIIYAMIYEFTGSMKTSVTIHMIHSLLMAFLINFVIAFKFELAETSFNILAACVITASSVFLIWFCTKYSFKIRGYYRELFSKKSER